MPVFLNGHTRAKGSPKSAQEILTLIKNGLYEKYDSISNRSTTNQSKIERVRSIDSVAHNDLYKKAKAELPAVLWSKTQTKKSKKEQGWTDYLAEMSDYVFWDFDKLTEQRLAEIWKHLAECPYIAGIWKSAGGKGIQAIMRVDIQHYKEQLVDWDIWQYFMRAIAVDCGIVQYDEKVVGNCDQVSYLSYDPNIYINPSPKVFKKTIKFSMPNNNVIKQNNKKGGKVLTKDTNVAQIVDFKNPFIQSQFDLKCKLTIQTLLERATFRETTGGHGITPYYYLSIAPFFGIDVALAQLPRFKQVVVEMLNRGGGNDEETRRLKALLLVKNEYAGEIVGWEKSYLGYTPHKIYNLNVGAYINSIQGLDKELCERGAKSILLAGTGVGKSVFALSLYKYNPIVIATTTNLNVMNIYREMRQRFPEIKDYAIVDKLHTNSSSSLRVLRAQVVITTYNSLPRVTRELLSVSPLKCKDYTLIVDEIHTLNEDAFKELGGDNVLSGVKGQIVHYGAFVGLSGTYTHLTINELGDAKIYAINTNRNIYPHLHTVPYKKGTTIVDNVIKIASEKVKAGYKVIIYRNEKDVMLKTLETTLGEYNILPLNADVKNCARTKMFMSNGEMGDVDIILGTKAIREGVSFYSKGKPVCLILAEHCDVATAQQLSFRVRDSSVVDVVIFEREKPVLKNYNFITSDAHNFVSEQIEAGYDRLDKFGLLKFNADTLLAAEFAFRRTSGVEFIQNQSKTYEGKISLIQIDLNIHHLRKEWEKDLNNFKWVLYSLFKWRVDGVWCNDEVASQKKVVGEIKKEVVSDKVWAVNEVCTYLLDKINLNDNLQSYNNALNVVPVPTKEHKKIKSFIDSFEKSTNLFDNPQNAKIEFLNALKDETVCKSDAALKAFKARLNAQLAVLGVGGDDFDISPELNASIQRATKFTHPACGKEMLVNAFMEQCKFHSFDVAAEWLDWLFEIESVQNWDRNENRGKRFYKIVKMRNDLLNWGHIKLNPQIDWDIVS